ncbi:MAG: hypothetical protein GQ573_04995 [Gammaproteobacteria bacterium]|nr:hypothetical protein [Gammaproteobacteria bacterium]
MPDDSTKIESGDRILFCGKREAMNSMHWILYVISSLNYVMNYKDEPESYFCRMIKRKFKGKERRNTQR